MTEPIPPYLLAMNYILPAQNFQDFMIISADRPFVHSIKQVPLRIYMVFWINLENLQGMLDFVI